MDIVAIVDAVLNPDTTSANCAGPGCDECADITSDNAEVIAAATEGMYTQAQMDEAVDEAVAAATPGPAPTDAPLGSAWGGVWCCAEVGSGWDVYACD